MTDEEYLQECIALCKTKEIDHGHRADFLGQYFNFQSSGGPNKWTKEMACKGALFCFALKKREEQIRSVIVFKKDKI